MQTSMQKTDHLSQSCEAQVNPLNIGQSIIAGFVACHRVWIAQNSRNTELLQLCTSECVKAPSCSIQLKLSVTEVS